MNSRIRLCKCRVAAAIALLALLFRIRALNVYKMYRPTDRNPDDSSESDQP